MARPSRIDRTFDGDYPTTGAVRTDVAEYLTENGFDRRAVDEALLVLSELYDNAIRYGDGGRPEVAVAVDLDGDRAMRLRIAVTNRGDVARIPARDTWDPMDPLALSGWGLSIVDTIATSVQVEGDRERTTVEAELRVG